MATKPLLPLPDFHPLDESPALVRIFDHIRFGHLSERPEYGEFTWFAREYPRVYRHHFDHAEYRLASIHRAYKLFHDEGSQLVTDMVPGEEHVLSRRPIMRRSTEVRPDTYAVYWDFESFLSAISSALDIAARIVGTAYKQVTPPNFNRFCKTAPADDLRAIFERAQRRWVRRMKEYRDCFVHYTPVDTLLVMGIREYSSYYQVRARLPVNPEIREILGFRYSVRLELLTYALTLWKHLLAFDRALAKLIWRRYQAGTYPVRIDNLFFLGQRARTPPAPAKAGILSTRG